MRSGPSKPAAPASPDGPRSSVSDVPKKGLGPTRCLDFWELLHGERSQAPDRPPELTADAVVPARSRPEGKRRDDRDSDRDHGAGGDPGPERPNRDFPELFLPVPIREAGANQAVSTAGPGPAVGTDPRTITEIAEKVLRTLRVGADASGRRVVQLQIGAGALAGVWIELRRESGGVRLQMREATGRDHPDLAALEAALRARGIQTL